MGRTVVAFRRASPLRSLIALAALGAAPSRAVDQPPRQIRIEPRFVEVSRKYADELGVFRRTGAEGGSQLLISLPSTVEGSGVDRLAIELDKKTARGMTPLALPPGWAPRVDGPLITLTGPRVTAPRLAVGLGGPELDPGLKLKVEVGAGGRVLLQLEPEIRALSAPRTVRELPPVLRLPQSLAPLDRIEVKPLDPRFTPGAGAWSFGGVRAEWNRSLSSPRYSALLPPGFGRGAAPGSRIRVRYTDDWGFLLVDAPASDVELEDEPRRAAGPPRVTGCPRHVLDGQTFCLCGDFPPGAASELLINGRPMGQYLVSSGPTILNFSLPSDLPPGPFEISGRSSITIADGEAWLVRVAAEIDRNRLQRGDSTTLNLRLEGTQEPIDLRVRNRTPERIRLDGGEEQVVTTSGGRRNDAVRKVHAVAPGDFVITYTLAVGSCACADDRVETGGDGYVETPIEPPKLDSPPPPRRDDELPRGIAHWDERVDGWTDRLRDIRCRDEAVEELVRKIHAELEALRKYLTEVAPEIEQLRLEADLLRGEDGAEARRRVAAYDALEQRAEALDEYLIDVLLLPRCEDLEDPGVTDDGGVPPGDFDVVSDPPVAPPPVAPPPDEGGKKKEEEPIRCGADITAAFEQALDRVARRIHELPAAEREEGAAAFVRRNAPDGWFDERDPEWTEPDAPDDHLIWWDAGPVLLERCALLDSPCDRSAWLWGRCLQAEFIDLLLEGTVEGLLGMPEGLSSEQKGYDDGSDMPIHAIGRDIGRQLARVRTKGGSPAAFVADLAGKFGGVVDRRIPLHACLRCEKCGLASTIFRRDWTQEDWELTDGRLQKPDGSIVKKQEKVF